MAVKGLSKICGRCICGNEKVKQNFPTSVSTSSLFLPPLLSLSLCLLFYAKALLNCRHTPTIVPKREEKKKVSRNHCWLSTFSRSCRTCLKYFSLRFCSLSLHLSLSFWTPPLPPTPISFPHSTHLHLLFSLFSPPPPPPPPFTF